MESIVAVTVLALVALTCVGALAFMAVRMTYALAALSSREGAEVLSEMVAAKPAEKKRPVVEVPADMANPAWSTEFARDMTDVADPNRGVA